MSANYQIKFYHPNRRLGRHEILDAVQVFLDRQYEIVSFMRGFNLIKAPDNIAETIDQVVDPNGDCLLNMVYDPKGKRWPVVFQTFAPETKDVQAVMSIEDYVFNKYPDRAGTIMLDMIGPLLEALGALFAWSDHEEMLRRLEKRLTFDRVEALAWANLFSRQMTELIGTKRLADTPAHKLVELPPGPLIVTVQNPTLPTTKEVADPIIQHWPGCQVREMKIPSQQEIG
jgi:hypothetical protein